MQSYTFSSETKTFFNTIYKNSVRRKNKNMNCNKNNGEYETNSVNNSKSHFNCRNISRCWLGSWFIFIIKC